MYTQATFLDLLEALPMETHPPQIIVRLRVEPSFDLDKLTASLKRCIQKVPELASSYHQRKNRFELFETCDPQSLIHEVSTIDFSHWDLEKEAQIQIQINAHDPCEVGIGFSHILCDGIGACQLLRLLCSFYQGEQSLEENNRLLMNLPQQKQKQPVGKRPKSIPPLIKDQCDPSQTMVFTQEIPLCTLKQLAHTQCITINDAIMSAYLYALSTLTRQQTISLPCPVNLRAFLEEPPMLTITNFTGGYEVSITNIQEKTMKQLNQEVQLAMKEERLRSIDLRLISQMTPISKVLPLSIMRFLARKVYVIPPVSYTNVGSLDAYLSLQNHEIKEAYVLTSPRIYPSLQLTVSSFHDNCMLSIHMKGNETQAKKAQQLLNHVKEQLLEQVT